MASNTHTPFPILTDPLPHDTSLPAFSVSTTRGFLPRADPITTLPAAFDTLESLLTRMPITTASGTAGLLAMGDLGAAVHKELPDLTDEVDKVKDDLPMVNALYRDYSFLASAYLLEPCHLRKEKGEGYGEGRDVLPSVIARPIMKCAEICGFKPFMEYAGSYALYNYRLADPAKGMDYDNLRLIRAFEHGLDRTSSEAGFVLVHVEMVKHSGQLVAGTVASLDACASSRSDFNTGLRTVLTALKHVNTAMETMWSRSRPARYGRFRTFIFGITSQDEMFPRGVVYEGVDFDDEDEGVDLGDGEKRPKGRKFRGESGANDSMIPLMDNLLQIPMPRTPLTEILRDFRQYRPTNHRAFLEYVRAEAERKGTRAFALGLGRWSNDQGEDDEDLFESRKLWLQVLDQVREFRWRHWCFGKEYILKRTSHPTATGGSPIVTWLPNQLKAVLEEMERVYEDSNGGLGSECADIMDLVGRQKETLRKEVERYCEERGVDKA